MKKLLLLLLIYCDQVNKEVGEKKKKNVTHLGMLDLSFSFMYRREKETPGNPQMQEKIPEPTVRGGGANHCTTVLL